MAGLYIHVPFCKQVCYYCDFHFSASMRYTSRMVEALCREIENRKEYTGASKFHTLYLGGGTPSVLSQEELSKLFATIDRVFGIQHIEEFTMEVNPDDLDRTYLDFLKKSGVNRLSIGIQSFSDPVLASMNRRHNAKQAMECVKMSQEAGFTNITIDLIYGYPGSPDRRWDNDLELAMSLDVPHISAYHLSIEDKTVFGRYLKKGKIAPVDESTSEREYTRLLEVTREHGYIHYEISNFARPGYEAQHNSSYWKQEAYLGIGPSAHSYNGKSRQWNPSNNTLYMSGIEAGNPVFEREELDENKKFNEYLLTALRTVWGVDLEQTELEFGKDRVARLLVDADPLVKRGLLHLKKNKVVVPESAWLVSDNLISTLFQV